MSAIDEDLTKIEEGTFRLQKDWERFFSGQERTAPFESRRRLEWLIRRYVGVEIRNNIERFRFQSLTARYNTLSDMWNRRLRAIEEGRSSVAAPLQQRREAAEALARAARPAGNAPARAEIRVSTTGEDEQAVRELYDQFKAARATAGEAEVKFESFKKLISQHRARLLEQKAAVAVAFRISVQDGKVALKAKPVRID